MNVGAQTNVVGQVPADMVGIVVNHNIVPGPVPAIAIGIIGRSDAEIETAKPESIPAASGKVPYVVAADPPGKVAVLPRMIEVVTGVTRAAFMPHPLAVSVNVGSVRMTFHITIITILCRWCAVK